MATCCSSSTSASPRWSTDWRKNVRGDDAAQFEEFAKRIAQFIEFRKELVRLGTEVSPAKGREWGDNEANRSVRTALNQDLDKLAAIYDARTKRIYAELQARLHWTVWLLSALAHDGARAGGGRHRHHRARGDAAARRHHARDRSRSPAARRRGRFRMSIGTTRSARWRARSACSSRRCERNAELNRTVARRSQGARSAQRAYRAARSNRSASRSSRRSARSAAMPRRCARPRRR